MINHEGTILSECGKTLTKTGKTFGKYVLYQCPEGITYPHKGVTLEEDISKLLSKLPKNSFTECGNGVKDGDYYCACLNCGRVVLVGKCCDNFLSENMLDKESKNG